MLFNEGVLVVDYGEPHYQKAVELAEYNGHKTAARLLRHFRSLAEVRQYGQVNILKNFIRNMVAYYHQRL